VPIPEIQVTWLEFMVTLAWKLVLLFGTIHPEGTEPCVKSQYSARLECTAGVANPATPGTTELCGETLNKLNVALDAVFVP
jgi:hypothetical protein